MPSKWAKYAILSVSADPFGPNAVFDLFEDGIFVCQFSRRTFREDLEKIDLSSKWIGSILRIFSKQFPTRFIHPSQDRSLCDRIGADKLVEHYRSRGFRVTEKLKVSDEEAISYLESKGYELEGLLNDCLYNSPFLKSAVEVS